MPTEPRRRNRVVLRRGQSLVELALIMPFLALMLIGAIDLGRIFYLYAQLTNSVQSGALYGRTLPNNVTSANSADPENIIYQVQNEGELTIAAADITVRCYAQAVDSAASIRSTTLRGNGNCSVSSGVNSRVRSGDIIEVTARYQFRPITTQLIAILPSNYKISKSVRMVIQ